MNSNINGNRAMLRLVALGVFLIGQQTAVQAENVLQIHNLPIYPVDMTEAADHERASDSSRESVTFGEVEVVRERYPDGKLKIERQVTLDAEGNYVNHGAWRLFSPTETIIAEGHYDMGRRVGNWTRWLDRNDSPVFSKHPFNRFKPPFVSQAVFNDGVMEGEWLVVDTDSRKVLQVSLVDGKRHGMVITFLPNGNSYRQETYDRGVPVGDVLEADGKTGELKRVATYIDGRRIITKTTHHRRGKQKKSEEMFLAAKTIEKTPDNFWSVQLAEYGSEGNDLRHGPSKVWYENGQLQVEGVYRQDKRSGPFAYWYANGQISAMGTFTDDQPDNEWVWWHENGQKSAIGNYDNGAQIGEWRWWQESGKLAEKKVFRGGEEAIAAKPQAEIRLGSAPRTGSTIK
jgi:antitoxin component YwqK of YwqJK toxin-antitoxin module